MDSCSNLLNISDPGDIILMLDEGAEAAIRKTERKLDIGIESEENISRDIVALYVDELEDYESTPESIYGDMDLLDSTGMYDMVDADISFEISNDVYSVINSDEVNLDFCLDCMM